MFTVPAVEAVQPDEKDEVIARDFSIIKQLI
jgi:hypothetical protein